MQRDRFPSEVAERLKWYVYRLIDPRNGETFYIGKGQRHRIFQHVKDALVARENEDATDLKLQRIKDIAAAGLEVGQVIHRYGIEHEQVAFQIEAALIDAYPGLANRIGGHESDDYGVRHVEEIIVEYTAQQFEAREPLILICISKSYYETDKTIYDAVRGVWDIKPERAENFKLVLAQRQGLVVGAFRPITWLPGNKANFPWLPNDLPERNGFVGEPAEQAVANLYVGKRVPDEYRSWGNPLRYIPETASRQSPERDISN